MYYSLSLFQLEQIVLPDYERLANPSFYSDTFLSVFIVITDTRAKFQDSKKKENFP